MQDDSEQATDQGAIDTNKLEITPDFQFELVGEFFAVPTGNGFLDDSRKIL